MAEHIDITGITDPKALSVIAKLLEKIAGLEERIARLERNSKTSSKPPSSDIVKPASENRQSGVRKIGGQPGHKGVSRRLTPLKEVDHIVPIEIGCCPECNGPVIPSGKILRQQVSELVEKPVALTEYQTMLCYCEHCQKTVHGSLPEGIAPGQRYGKRVQALLMYLKGAMGATYTELRDLCVEVFDIKATRSGICNIVMRGSEELAPFHRKIRLSARKSKRLNIDESSWKRNGKWQWAWVFCNQDLAYFSVEKTRGRKVLTKTLGEKTSVAVTSDFLGSYAHLPKEQHQYCLAHLIRDIKYLQTLPDAVVRKTAGKFLQAFRRIFSMLHRSDPPPKIKKVINRLHNYLARTHSSHRELRNLLRRLNRHWTSLWRFVEQPELFEPTNNLAERSIRHLVRLRKTSQGSRSKKGDSWIARFCSLFLTSKLRHQSVWANLCQHLAVS